MRCDECTMDVPGHAASACVQAPGTPAAQWTGARYAAWHWGCAWRRAHHASAACSGFITARVRTHRGQVRLWHCHSKEAAPTDDMAVIGRWPAEQVGQLHRLLGQHVQLLMTTFCAAAALPGYDALVGTSGSMIHALQVGRLVMGA